MGGWRSGGWKMEMTVLEKQLNKENRKGQL